MAVETAAVKADRIRRYGSRNRSARRPIERSRPSRAAIAPPRQPSQRVACWTRAFDPGIPVRQTRRPTISRSGRTAIPTRRAIETAFSTRSASVAGRRSPSGWSSGGACKPKWPFSVPLTGPALLRALRGAVLVPIPLHGVERLRRHDLPAHPGIDVLHHLPPLCLDLRRNAVDL